MRFGLCLAMIGVMTAASACEAQQRSDPNADLTVAVPAWASGTGPRLVIDGGHFNFHTVDGRYEPFAQVMRNDGLRVSGSTGSLTAASLAEVDILVISNALHERNQEDWILPTPSAFTAEEIAAVRAWVEGGGALLLIADHMPFGGAVQDMAAAFGFQFDNSFALIEGPEVFSRRNGRMLDSPLTQGLTEVRSFTGSTFRAPPEATVALRLDGAFTVVTPNEAWRFSGQPRRPATTEDARLASMTVGKGRLVVSAEAAMFSAQVAGPRGDRAGLNAEGAEQNKPLLLNLIRWLAA